MSAPLPPDPVPPPLPSTSNDPVERKVKTSTVTAAVAAFVLSLLQLYVFRGDDAPDGFDVVVSSLVSTVFAGLATFIVGYRTRHTARQTGRPPVG